MRTSKLFLAAVCMAILVGASACSTTTPETTEPETQGLGPQESLETPESDILEGRTSGPMLPVYFEFDSSVIAGEQTQRIEKNSAYLLDNSEITIRIEGNCDPRGTKEYNLALGERRALSAKKALAQLGVTEDRMTTVSWGEEKLLLFGQDELSWAQNRRDDFVIVK